MDDKTLVATFDSRDHALRAQIVNSGSAMPMAMEAARLLAEDFDVAADVWSAPGWQRLRQDALDCEEWNRLHPTEERRKLFAAIRLCRLAMPGMRARRWGRIINVLNIGAKAPPGEGAPTAVSRAAGMALTKVLANEGAKDNVLVNALLVGIIESDQWARRHAADKRNITWDEWKEEMGRPVPVGRLGRPEEFAGLALYLCIQVGGYVTGTAINVDGGRSPVV